DGASGKALAATQVQRSRAAGRTDLGLGQCTRGNDRFLNVAKVEGAEWLHRGNVERSPTASVSDREIGLDAESIEAASKSPEQVIRPLSQRREGEVAVGIYARRTSGGGDEPLDLSKGRIARDVLD